MYFDNSGSTPYRLKVYFPNLPRRSASVARSRTPSFRSSWEMWFFTVPSARWSSAVISRLFLPWATRVATPRSVRVGGPRRGRRRRASRRRCPRCPRCGRGPGAGRVRAQQHLVVVDKHDPDRGGRHFDLSFSIADVILKPPPIPPCGSVSTRQPAAARARPSCGAGPRIRARGAGRYHAAAKTAMAAACTHSGAFGSCGVLKYKMANSAQK